MALLAGMLHDLWTNPRLGDWLAAIEGSSLVADPLSAEAVNVRELRRAYDRERRLPRLLRMSRTHRSMPGCTSPTARR